MKYLFIVAVHFVVISSFAQNPQFSIKNTQWNLKIRELKNLEVKVHFKEDTVVFFYFIDSEQQSSCSFSQNGDTLTIIKTSGRERCPIGGKGIYTIEPMDNGEKFQ